LEKTVSILRKKKENNRIHKDQIANQKTYNSNTINDMLRDDPDLVKVTIDYGGSYFIHGGKFVCLVMFLRFKERASGDLVTEIIYNLVSDPDERSEDAYLTCFVFKHHDQRAGTFDCWSKIIEPRDSGPHFQCNKVCYFESTVKEMFCKDFSVSAFAKRHGWNECDGSFARLVGEVRNQSLEGAAPTNAKEAAACINDHQTKFGNCYAYYFDKIERDPDIFPKLVNFNGIQAEKFCEFKYEWHDFDGSKVQKAGYVLARQLSGRGAWTFHDFLPKSRPSAWGKRCVESSNTHARAVHHTHPGEPFRSCRQQQDRREIIQPNPDDVNPAVQPPPRSARRRSVNPGPGNVQCPVCAQWYN
jgi:hypothetical protein